MRSRVPLAALTLATALGPGIACTGPAGGGTRDADDGSTEGAPPLADVLSVDVTGSAGAWTFDVTVRSPDTGCDQYASWWEVVGAEDETLAYRRILGHSHVDEQPFTRSGGPVTVSDDAPLVVRAWLHPDGYGGQALQGTVADGFSAWEAPDGWAAVVAEEAPQPDGCAF